MVQLLAESTILTLYFAYIYKLFTSLLVQADDEEVWDVSPRCPKCGGLCMFGRHVSKEPSSYASLDWLLNR